MGQMENPLASEIANLVGCDPETVKLSAPETPQLVHPLVTMKHVASKWPVYAYVPHYLGVDQRQPYLKVVALPGVRRPPHDLHVLLRHRLLRQAEVGERVIGLPIDHERCHPAASDVEQRRYIRRRLRALQSACLDAPTVRGKPE